MKLRFMGMVASRMKIEDQVCSIEHAKKLKELGVNQESLWHWIERDSQDIYMFPFELLPLRDGIEYESYAAFTVMELGLRLPQSITQDGKYYRLDIFKDKICWFIAYVTNQSEPPFIIHMNMKEVNSRASMLIHLIENNLITLL